jgi:hypothetical protein
VEQLQAIDACIDDIRIIHKAVEGSAMLGARKLARKNLGDRPIPYHIIISWPIVDWPYIEPDGISKVEFLAMTLCSRGESLLPKTERDAFHEAQKKQLQIYWIIDKMDSLDKDTDGYLSKDEASFSSFDTIDQNDDERLSKDELLEYSIAEGFPRTYSPPASPRKR